MTFKSGIDKALGNTKKETEIGIGGFKLFAKIRDTTNYKNIVPVDFLEDGTNATDDIINEPITVSIDGVVGDAFVGEVNYPEIATKDYSAVGEISALLPSFSSAQSQAISQINTQLREATLLAKRVERIGGNVIELFDNSASTSKSDQDKFVEFMEAVYYSGQPIQVSTNRRDYDNMALSDLSIEENNETGSVEFTAKFSQINYLQLVYAEVSNAYAAPSKALAGKTSSVSNQGGQTPEANAETSLLSSLFG